MSRLSGSTTIGGEVLKILLYPYFSEVGDGKPVAEFNAEVGGWALGKNSAELSSQHFSDFAVFRSLEVLSALPGRGLTVHVSCGGWVFPCDKAFGLRVGGDRIPLMITTKSDSNGVVTVCAFKDVRHVIEDPKSGDPLPPERLTEFVTEGLLAAKTEAREACNVLWEQFSAQTVRLNVLVAVGSAP